MTALIGWVGWREAEFHTRRELSHRLDSVVDTSSAALRTWLESHRELAESVVRDPEFIGQAETVAAGGVASTESDFRAF